MTWSGLALREAGSLPDLAVHAHVGVLPGRRERLSDTLHPLAGQTVPGRRLPRRRSATAAQQRVLG
jgi:hypothetical protein